MSPEETKKPVETDIESESGDPVESLFLSVTKNWKELLVGLVIAGAVIAAVAIYQNKSRDERETAFKQLSLASTPSQFSEIIRQFPSTKAAEMAALMAARTKYDSGAYDEADQLYAEFIAKHPKHYMVPAAKLGRVHCQEASGQVDEALAAYKAFVTDNPSEKALITVARLGEARCLRAKGQLQEAVALYDRLILELPESEWKPLIEDLKTATVKDLARLSSPVAEAPAPAAAPVMVAPEKAAP